MCAAAAVCGPPAGPRRTCNRGAERPPQSYCISARVDRTGPYRRCKTHRRRLRLVVWVADVSGMQPRELCSAPPPVLFACPLETRNVRQRQETAKSSLSGNGLSSRLCLLPRALAVSLHSHTRSSDARRRFRDASHGREDERHRSGVVVEYVWVRAGWSVVRRSLLSQIAFLGVVPVFCRRPRHEAVSAFPHHAERDGPSGRPLTYMSGCPPGPETAFGPA